MGTAQGKHARTRGSSLHFRNFPSCSSSLIAFLLRGLAHKCVAPFKRNTDLSGVSAETSRALVSIKLPQVTPRSRFGSQHCRVCPLRTSGLLGKIIVPVCAAVTPESTWNSPDSKNSFTAGSKPEEGRNAAEVQTGGFYVENV